MLCLNKKDGVARNVVPCCNARKFKIVRKCDEDMTLGT